MTRVYTPGGTTAHLLDDLLSPNQPNSAMCGRTPQWPDLWHGTGTQEEYDRAAEMRLCAQCDAAAEHRRNSIITR